MGIRRTVRIVLAVLALVAGVSRWSAGQRGWEPSAGHTQIPIWPGAVPHARPLEGPEIAGTVVDAAGRPQLVGGKPWIYVNNVSQPTMTVYSPRQTNSGAAVVVFPGGGYNILAIDLEGTEACEGLASRGITGAVLEDRGPGAQVRACRRLPAALRYAQ